jgi:prephenate dehydratase
MQTRVAIQGERGAFSDSAARKFLGDDIDVLACRTFDEVFDAVREGRAGAAVVPIENSLAGSILRTYDLLGERGVEMVGETFLPIRLTLIARPGATIDSIRRVSSHPVALAQCQRFLARVKGIEAVAAYDTAGSVKLLMESGESSDAAIAGAEAASIYGAEVLERDLEDDPANYTRFVLICTADRAAALRLRVGTGAMKTTVLFRTPDKPGALFRALAAFALRDINLSKLESRPIAGRPWEYAFYADIAGGADEPNVANALNHLREMCDQVSILGSYVATADVVRA